MKIEENKEVIITKSVIVECKCDVCGKSIIGPYWELVTGHHDWGNDSVDSITEEDLCSKECVLEKMSRYFRDCNDSNTQYFQLEQSIFRGEK